MNTSFIGSRLLASGQSAPFTGDWVSIAESKEALFVVYGSGVSSGVSPTIQIKTYLAGDPAFTDAGGYAGVPIYTFNSIGNGYAAPSFLQAPAPHVRIVVPSGSGQIWAYAAIQN